MRNRHASESERYDDDKRRHKSEVQAFHVGDYSCRPAAA
jgi:hypothetical protein